MCNATIALIAAWCIGSIVALSVSCSPARFVNEQPEQQCHLQTKFRVITAFDIFTEILLMVLPIFFISPIQMKRYIKFQVVIAFGFRLPVMGFAAAHLHYVSKYAHSSNVSKAIIPALVFQQFELFWSLLAATIPTLKAFMRSFNSGFGMEIDLDGYSSTLGSRGYYPGSVPLQSLQNATTQHGVVTASVGTNRSRSRKATQSGSRSASHSRLRVKEQVRVTASINSDDSQELIIQREVEWSVRSEELFRK